MTYTIKRLYPDDASALRALRLESLQNYPLHYTGTYEHEAKRDIADFHDMISACHIVGAWDGKKLIAIARLTPDARPRNEHKALLHMVYVTPEYQGNGVTRAMLTELFAQAISLGFEQILLAVGHDNEPAIHIYRSMGFKQYGYEPKAAKTADGHYLDDILMIRFL